MIDLEEAPPGEAVADAATIVLCPTSSVVVLGYN
jgi:hypothetical protein